MEPKLLFELIVSLQHSLALGWAEGDVSLAISEGKKEPIVSSGCCVLYIRTNQANLMSHYDRYLLAIRK